MRDRQPDLFLSVFRPIFPAMLVPYIVIIREHVICVKDIRQKHNKHRKTDTKKRTAIGVTLLVQK